VIYETARLIRGRDSPQR